MEQRHDWASFKFTPELFKYVFFTFLPEVILHTQNQDEEQVRGHYDRKQFMHYSCSTRSKAVFQAVTISTNGTSRFFMFILKADRFF
jgi:hypothetical protein